MSTLNVVTKRLLATLQVVDMRWGLRDEATDDHMGTELCLKELRLCQQLSTGPSFVVRTSGPWSSHCAILFASYMPRYWKTELNSCE
ncbi:hypothetical protein DPMN_014873 [Dreissena polymorpha]|uniref:Uncharacterized protein n=1 Tax=Dreissena polymorpha TaxID=45954 RepID=A0A9D4NAH6_DREPO|nr:hypothetical protein DPMN_014873 [Dreissena polymorpha]